MHRVWHCDFCSDTGSNIKSMKVHEFNCSSNPKKKKCYSCKHHVYELIWSEYECAEHISLGKMWEVEEGESKCVKWEKK